MKNLSYFICYVLISGLYDQSFSAYPYLMGGLGVLAQSMSQTLIQKFGEEKISNIELLQVISYNTVIPFFLMCFLYESQEVVKYDWFTGE